MSRSKKLRIPAFFISLMLTVSLIGAPLSARAYELPAGTAVSAPEAILVSLGPAKEDDDVLFERDADSKRSPAALINFMIAATAIKIIRDKNIDIDKTTGTYTVDCANAISGTGVSPTPMNLNEVWTLRDLLSVSMIKTSGEAVMTLAVTLSGSQAQFVAEMNNLAKEIGCTNTSFANVIGIDNINQYTTARDTYKIIRYAMDYPEFEPLFSAYQYECNPVSGGDKRAFYTTNDMMRSTKPTYYSPLVFGKTGFTDAAGRCLGSVARDSGYEYLCVVLGCPITDENGQANAHYTDTKTLYKWAFNNFTYKTLLNKNQPIAQMKVRLAWNKDNVTLVPEKEFATTVTNDLDPSSVRMVPTYPASVDAPVTKGQVYGKVELYINIDQKIGEVNLVANESIDKSEVLSVWDQIQKFLTSPWFYVGIALLVILLIGYVILNILHNRKRKKNRMKRVKKY